LGVNEKRNKVLGIGLNFFNNLIIAVISSTLVDKHGLQGDAFFGTFNLNPSMQTSDQVKGKPLDLSGPGSVPFG